MPAPPRATLRTEQKAATRRRLMNAAMEVMAEKGYAAATVEEIALLAGASPATFYLHFKRKVDVLITVVEDENSQITETAGPLPRPGHDLDVGSLKGWIERLFATWQLLLVPHQVLGQAALIEPELKSLQSVGSPRAFATGRSSSSSSACRVAGAGERRRRSSTPSSSACSRSGS